jgi:hypothetical protein
MGSPEVTAAPSTMSVRDVASVMMARVWSTARHLDASQPRFPLARQMPVRHETVLLLELDAEPAEDQLRIARRVHSMRRRMHAVDGDVNMQVVRVVMHDARAVMVVESELGTGPPLDGLEHVVRRMLAERQHDVIRGVPRTAVARLGVLDLEDSARNIPADAC